MKKIILSITALFATGLINAQQAPFFTNYFLKPMLYNPAMTGSTGDNPNFFLLHRNQFNSFQGGPQINLGAFEGMLQHNKGYGGVIVSNQRIGLTSNTNALVTYAYRANLNFEQDIYLKFGLAVGLLDQRIDYNKIVVKNYADPYILYSSQNKSTLDGNAGVQLYAKGFSFGLSVPQLLGGQLKYEQGTTARSYYMATRHYMASLGYQILVNEEKEMYITPNGMLRFLPNAPIQYDGSVYFDWKDHFYIGATYKADYAVGINAGFTLNRRLSIGYSYDYMIGNITKYAGMSHELTASITLGKLKPRPNDDTLTPEWKKILDLQKQIDEIKTKGVSTNNPSKDKVEKVNPSQFSGKNVVKQNGVYVITNNTKDFTFISGKMAPKGYYVVVETCYYPDFADNEAKRYAHFGFPDADVIVDKTNKFHYVYIDRVDNKTDAFMKVKQAKDAGVPDVWIQVLIE